MSATMPVQSIVLDKLKVAASGRLSAQMAHEARAQVYVDHFADGIVAELQTSLLRHKVDAQTVRVPFEKTESVETPGPRLVVPAAALLVALGMVLGAITASLPVFVLTAAVALVFVVLYAVNPPRDVTLTAKGEAVVDRVLFNAFPDATIVYPENLGDIWLPMQDVRLRTEYTDEMGPGGDSW